MFFICLSCSLKRHWEGSDCNLRSTETNLQIPLLRACTGQKAFSHRGAKLWNEFNKETKLEPSLTTFKKTIWEVHFIFCLVLLCSFAVTLLYIVIFFDLGFLVLNRSVCKTYIWNLLIFGNEMKEAFVIRNADIHIPANFARFVCSGKNNEGLFE